MPTLSHRFHRGTLSPIIRGALSAIAVLSMLMPISSWSEPPASVRGVSSIVKKISAALDRRGLAILPDALTALQAQKKAGKSDAARLDDWLTGLAVIGTPPTLSTLSTQAVETFWRPGVVEAIAQGAPTQQQCREFFSSPIDGESGGFGACLMAESVGQSFETAIDAAQSLCRLAKIPEVPKSNITIVSGAQKLPGRDVRKIFVSSEAEDRLVRINIPKSSRESGAIKTFRMFARIPSERSNQKKNLLYRAELYFCGDKTPTPFGFNSVQVSNSGVLTIVNKNAGDPFSAASQMTVSLEGQLTPDGSELEWDVRVPRTGQVQFLQQREGQLRGQKAVFSIFSDGLELKRVNKFGDFLRKEFIAAAFTAQSALDARFLAGGFKINDGSGRLFANGTEFRTPVYAAAPSSEYQARAASVDFAADPFYSTPPEVTVDLRRYSCSAKPTVEVTMIRDAKSEAVLRPCFENRLEDMNFCSGTQLIEQARSRYPSVCTGP